MTKLFASPILLAIVSAPFARLEKVSVDREKFRLVCCFYFATVPHGNHTIRRCVSIYNANVGINRSQGRARWYNPHFTLLNYIPIYTFKSNLVI